MSLLYGSHLKKWELKFEQNVTIFFAIDFAESCIFFNISNFLLNNLFLLDFRK